MSTSRKLLEKEESAFDYIKNILFFVIIVISYRLMRMVLYKIFKMDLQLFLKENLQKIIQFMLWT